jgi:hypothetical protein
MATTATYCTNAVDAYKSAVVDFMKKTVASPTAWNNAVEMIGGGRLTPPGIHYHAAKSFVEQKRYELNVNIPNSWHLEQMAEMSEPVLRLLAARRWGLSRTLDAELVTSDSPVSLISFGGKAPRLIGFGSANTLLTLPLTPNLLLHGCLGSLVVEEVLDDWRVATINTSTIGTSHRFVYSRSQEFVVRDNSSVAVGTPERARALWLRSKAS